MFSTPVDVRETCNASVMRTEDTLMSQSNMACQFSLQIFPHLGWDGKKQITTLFVVSKA